MTQAAIRCSRSRFNARKENTDAGKLLMRSVDVVDIGTAKFDLRLDFLEGSSSLEGYLEYSADLFRPDTAARMAEHLHTLLRRSSSRPGLPHFRAAFAYQLMSGGGSWSAGTRRAFHIHSDSCVHQIFERCARTHPDRSRGGFGAQ